jgi:hypothetical protein
MPGLLGLSRYAERRVLPATRRTGREVARMSSQSEYEELMQLAHHLGGADDLCLRSGQARHPKVPQKRG